MPTAEQVISKDLGRILVEAVPDLVCLCRDGRVVHVNSAGARLLGLAAPALMTGRPFVDFVHADFQEIFADGLEELAAENDTLPLIFNRGAGTVEVELSVRVLDNGLVALHGRDITERTHAVEVLLKSEERYRRLVELALDFTCICTGGLLRFVNAAGVRLLGVTAAADLSDRPLLDIVHPADRFLLADGLGALVGRPEPIPMRFLREDGAVVEAETVVLPLGMGDDCSFMMEARDVTALKRSAETLREREQKLQGIMDTVADGIITADETGTIQSINPAAQRIFGYEAAEAVGGNLAMLMPEP
ncbi:MAG: PAS domain S-box protein, partial [Rhodospirillales bacterium]|nr:PAS domain S-box protein [Rhodospirillales bacterium]